MVTVFKRAAIAAAVAGALSVPLSAQAAVGIVFDPTGTGAAGLQMDQWVWGSNTVIGETTFISSALGADGDVDTQNGFLVGQGRLQQFKKDNADVANPNGNTQDFTYEFRIRVVATVTRETLNNAAGSPFAKNSEVSFENDTTGTPLVQYGADNYFRIYHTPTPVDLTAGTGFGDSNGQALTAGQTMIFEGKVDIGSAGASYSISNAGGLTAIGTAGTLTRLGLPINTITGSGGFNLEVEHCSATEAGSGDLSTTKCINGATLIDTAYFRSDVNALSVDLTLANQINTPFPPIDAVPERVNNVLPNFGTDAQASIDGEYRNNFVCEGGVTPCDMLFHGTSADSDWKGSFAPEPGSVALLGLGLALLGGLSRRRKAGSAA